ncbi:MAG: DUF3870 domain-containing protein [Lawsonibacter sp.]
METPKSRRNKAATYYVIGESRTNMDNAITKQYGSFYMAFEVEEETDEVLDFDCTHTLEITNQFLRKYFVGEHFSEIETWLEEWLEQYYGGSSRRAVLAAYHDALKRYRTLKKGQ